MEPVENEADEVVDEEPQILPWYRDPDSDHPFRLYKKMTLGSEEHLRTLALFPWDDNSLSTLWEGSLATEENLTKWKGMLSKFRDAVIVCGDTEVYVLWLKRRKHPLMITIPEHKEPELIHADKTNAAWVLSPNAIEEPCVAFTRGSLLWIYNPVHKGLSSYLRGHGGAITSIVVHPVVPNLFCTTSRDHTTRIYDLTLRPHNGFKDPDVNPHWPPGTLPSRAGAPHGLHMNEPEGEGIGRCIIVLMGGRSGGHQAAVLNASFHPTYPVIATCGIDRCVKIWHVHPRNSKQITREDKPLFSSSRIHRSRVLSVRWLNDEILMSHSPSSTLRTDPLDPDNKDTYLAPGEIVVWKWLALLRFFPPKYDDLRAEGKTQSVLRGCASDYQESSSFTMLANGSFPDIRLQLISPSVHLYNSPTHDPVAACVIPAGLPFFKRAGKIPEKPQAQSPSKSQTSSDKINNDSGSQDPPKVLGPALPPDEPPVITKTLSNGEVRQYAGTVTLVHVPSLPLRLPSRFPLDKPPGLAPDTSTDGASQEESKPKLYGLSTINPGLIERDNPPPILGWTLYVPLDAEDLAYESTSPSNVGDAMETDGHSGGTRGASGKGKGKEKVPQVTQAIEESIKVRLQTAALGMGGKVIVVLGTRGRIWIYRIKKG
ncbi:hypothetical protein NP233_g2285 [Leucocoprinus birnbaumii]|uniref:WD40 repeat-like protein n=1 Tax=Leucocoprinus birnbaumii TaxID=56174 RepID=A0AAD5VZ84_9AGAR|nr:hypothetical protein NP233_g2285 [Leucocoprinus birnbaumii]